MIYQDLIQEEITHLFVGIKAHRLELVLTQYQSTVGFLQTQEAHVFLGFGLYGGKLYISGDSTYSTGSTTVADGNWRMCAFTYTTNDIL